MSVILNYFIHLNLFYMFVINFCGLTRSEAKKITYYVNTFNYLMHTMLKVYFISSIYINRQYLFELVPYIFVFNNFDLFGLYLTQNKLTRNRIIDFISTSLTYYLAYHYRYQYNIHCLVFTYVIHLVKPLMDQDTYIFENLYGKHIIFLGLFAKHYYDGTLYNRLQ